MKTMKTLFAAATASLIGGLHSTALADTAPAPRAASVFAISQGILLRCAERNSINIALANAATVIDDRIAQRDIVRVLNSCARDLKLPRREAFAAIGASTVSETGCDTGSCTPQAKEKLAKTVFEANHRFKFEYAAELLQNLRSSCADNLKSDCVDAAIQASNKNVELFDHPWLLLTDDRRIKHVGDDIAHTTSSEDEGPKQRIEVKAVSKSIRGIRDRSKTLWPDDLPSSIDLAGKTGGQYAAAGFFIKDDGILVEGLENPVKISTANGYWKVNVTASKAECIALLRDTSSYEADEITVGPKLVTRATNPAEVCSSDQANISFVFEG